MNNEIKNLEFNFQFGNPPSPVYEKGGGEKLVDASGYISAEEQILSMLNAGIRLDEQRKELYDYEGDGENIDFDSIPVDFTRMPGVDMADISQLSNMVESKLRNQEREAKEKELKVEEKKEE